MGITFSTENYEKLINLIEEPYFDKLKTINKNFAEALNIDNDNRKLVYKHRTKEIYLLYTGGICNVSQCFEVNENFLLRQSRQFSNFYELKDFVLKEYPKSELIMEIIKYESKNYIDIIDLLEKGEYKEVVLDFEFTDSETTGSSDSDVEEENTELNTDWVVDWNYDTNSFNEFICNWDFDNEFVVNKTNTNNSDPIFNFTPPYVTPPNITLPNVTPHNVTPPNITLLNVTPPNSPSLIESIKDKAIEATEVSEKSKIYSHGVIYNSETDLLLFFSKEAVTVAQNAAIYADFVATECINEIEDIYTYEKDYMEIIDEEIINNEDDSDDDLIFPNMNYFNTL